MLEQQKSMQNIKAEHPILPQIPKEETKSLIKKVIESMPIEPTVLPKESKVEIASNAEQPTVKHEAMNEPQTIVKNENAVSDAIQHKISIELMKMQA